MVLVSSPTIKEINFSPFFSVIPLTPLAVRPIGLTCDSENLINFPEDEARRISSLPDVIAVPINTSSSSRFIALIPDLYFFANRLRLVFLVVPFFVAIKINLSSVNSSTGRISLTDSSSSRLSIFTKGLPLEILDATGISYTFNQKTFPLVVKHRI